MSDVLSILKSEGYKWGDCQVLRYDPKRPDIFPEGYVSSLYWAARGDTTTAHGRKQASILPSLFCGMSNLSHDSITTYLLTLPLLIPVLWSSPTSFIPVGIGFPTLFQPPLNIPVEPGQRMAFAGYGFFHPFWGDPHLPTLAMLGLAYIFQEFGLSAIHGIRYTGNRLTARFMAQFGFTQTGAVPRYQLEHGVLVPGVVSSLMREDFERYVEHKLLELTSATAGEVSDGRKRAQR